MTGVFAFAAPSGAPRMDQPDSGLVCVENIGPRERRLRLRFGALAFAAGAVLAAGLILAGVHPAWRLAVYFPFAAAATGVLQAREKT